MLLDIIDFRGKKWITSKKLHEDMKPTSGISETNRAIRLMPAYASLLEDGHVFIADRSEAEGDAEIASLVKANSYNQVMLIDPVAQKEIEHHFEVSVNQAIQSSRENALLGVAGINLAALAKDPSLVLLLRALSDQAEIKEAQARHAMMLNQLQEANTKTNKALESIIASSNYVSAMGFLRSKLKMVSNADALKLGKRASKMCREGGVKIETIHSEVHGKVNTYPEDILEAAYQEIVSEEME